jgi:hypothetical protein
LTFVERFSSVFVIPVRILSRIEGAPICCPSKPLPDEIILASFGELAFKRSWLRFLLGPFRAAGAGGVAVDGVLVSVIVQGETLFRPSSGRKTVRESIFYRTTATGRNLSAARRIT